MSTTMSFPMFPTINLWEILRGFGLERRSIAHGDWMTSSAAVLNPEHMAFETRLYPNEEESGIPLRVKIGRLEKEGHIFGGAHQAIALWQNHEASLKGGQKSVLDVLHETKGITWIDFPATRFRGFFGARYILAIHLAKNPQGKLGWVIKYYPLPTTCTEHHVSLVLR